MFGTVALANNGCEYAAGVTLPVILFVVVILGQLVCACAEPSNSATVALPGRPVVYTQAAAWAL